jgi:hypothetical protein
LAEKNKRKIYYPSELEVNAYKLCIKNNIAFCMTRISIDNDLYYIERYDPKYYNKSDYLRIDFNKPYSFNNRLKLQEYDAWKKVFELYLMQANILNKTVERESKEVELVRVEEVMLGAKPIQSLDLSTQIDLLDMIREVEEENKSLDK